MLLVSQSPPEPGRSRIARATAGLSLSVLLLATGCNERETAPEKATPAPSPAAEAPIIAEETAVAASYAGTGTCQECHAEETAKWRESHHHFAERPYRADMDGDGFEPPREIAHGTQKSKAALAEEVAAFVTRGFENKSGRYPVVRVIGHDPLRQFLVSGPNDHLHAVDLCWDPHQSQWFNVYGDEDRQPGEWGHWTGRGMSWEAMCASCHNTRFRKNYDPESDRYNVTMAEMSVGCEACHGPMKEHVDWQHEHAGSGPDPTLPGFTRDQYTQTCAPCHARRGELTGDLVPGDSFHDHFLLTIPDESDIYYPDGQVREEDYVYASFLGSSMHAAGVRCGDCHDPHSGERILEGNSLCMRCHVGGTEPIPPLTKAAPAIDPVSHGNHAPGSAANECTSCHMPITTYMQRDPRRDHGFTIPDPLLTKKFGIPNACNRCHQDKDADWSLEWVEQWYGEKMDRPTRHRATAFAEAKQGLFAARDKLLAILRSDENPMWKASACLLLRQWALETPVTEALQKQLKHGNPLLRASAVRALGPALEAGREDLRAIFRPLLEDPSRNVRVETAWVLRETVPLESRAGRELLHSLDINADQPAGQMRLGQFRFARGDRAEAVGHLRKAIEWDPNSPPFHHDLAVMLNIAGDNRGAMEALREAARLDPTQAEYLYKLALAQNEEGNLPGAIQSLRKAVEVDPAHGRAWYNLGLAHNTLGQAEPAIDALARGERVTPGDPGIPYARATILARLGRTEEAILAAERALEIDPNYVQAHQILRALSP